MEEQQNTIDKKIEDLLAQFDEYGFIPSVVMENAEDFAIKYKQELTKFVRVVLKQRKNLEKSFERLKYEYQVMSGENAITCRECIDLLELGCIKACIDRLEDLFVKEYNKSVPFRLHIKRVKE